MKNRKRVKIKKKKLAFYQREFPAPVSVSQIEFLVGRGCGHSVFIEKFILIDITLASAFQGLRSVMRYDITLLAATFKQETCKEM